MEPLTVVLLYSLRFCVIFSVVVLWVVAVSDVGSHVRKGLFTRAQLASMVVAVSVIAVGAIVALNATVLSHRWAGIDPKRQVTVVPARQKCEAFSYTFTYSFGLRGFYVCAQGVCGGTHQQRPPVPRNSTKSDGQGLENETEGPPYSSTPIRRSGRACTRERGCRSRDLHADGTAFPHS